MKKDDLEYKIKTDYYNNFYNFQQDLNNLQEYFEVYNELKINNIIKYLERSS